MGVMTWSALRDLINQGRGQGHGDRYKPWLWIRRRNSSPQSNQVAARLPGFRRRSDFFARSEWHLALLCLWLGAKDVREQLSLWPWPHSDPLAGASGSKAVRLTKCRGALEIAKEAGIEHGCFVGTSIPYVATADLCVTVELVGVPTLSFLALKPMEHVVLAEPEDQLLARLELGRRYAYELNYRHRIGHEAVLTKELRANLEWWSSGAVLPKHLAARRIVECFASRFSDVAADDSMSGAIKAAAEASGIRPEEGPLLFRHVAWHRLIDIDISEPVLLTRPLVPDRKGLVKALQMELFGVVL